MTNLITPRALFIRHTYWIWRNRKRTRDRTSICRPRKSRPRTKHGVNRNRMIRRGDIAIWFFKMAAVIFTTSQYPCPSYKSYPLSIPRGQAQLSRVIHAGGTHMWTHRAPRFPDHSLDWFPTVHPIVQCPWPPTSEAGPLSVCVTCTRWDPSATTPDILR